MLRDALPLRYHTPLQLFERWVLEDSQICGVAVPKGAELGLLFGSSNRDPDVFETILRRIHASNCWPSRHGNRPTSSAA